MATPQTTRSKIVYPSQPPQAPDPVLSSVAGGALAATTYYVRTTWVVETQDGNIYESLPSNEVSLPVGANNLLVVQSPPPLPMPYMLLGWNVYVATTASTGEGYGAGPYGGIPYGGGAGLFFVSETLQNLTMLAIGANWQEPTSGLILGVSPPSTWGTVLVFNFPGREFPYSNRDAKASDNFSVDGVEQSIVWYVDNILDFRLPAIQSGADASAWDQFFATAILRVPWDFYLDSTKAEFVTVFMTNATVEMAYYQPGLYSADVRARQVILTQ